MGLLFAIGLDWIGHYRNSPESWIICISQFQLENYFIVSCLTTTKIKNKKHEHNLIESPPLLLSAILLIFRYSDCESERERDKKTRGFLVFGVRLSLRWRAAPSLEVFSQISHFAPPAILLPLLSSAPSPPPIPLLLSLSRYNPSSHPLISNMNASFFFFGFLFDVLSLFWNWVLSTVSLQLQKQLPLASYQAASPSPFRRYSTLSNTFV